MRFAASLFLIGESAWTTRAFEPATYLGEPSNIVRILNEMNCQELLVSSKSQLEHVLRLISDQASMPLCFSGAVTTSSEAQQVARLGYEKISISSAYLDNPAAVGQVAEQLGQASTVLTLAVRKVDGVYMTWDWRSRETVTELSKVLNQLPVGDFGELHIRDVERNGSGNGPDFNLASLVRNGFGGNLIFEGGIADFQDVQELWNLGVECVASSTMISTYGPYSAALINYKRQ